MSLRSYAKTKNFSRVLAISIALSFSYCFMVLILLGNSVQVQADTSVTNDTPVQTKDSFYLVVSAATALAGVVVFLFLRGEKKDAQMVAVLKEHSDQTLKIIEANTTSANAVVAAQNNMSAAINSLKDNVTEAILQATQRDVREEKRRNPTGK